MDKEMKKRRFFATLHFARGVKKFDDSVINHLVYQVKVLTYYLAYFDGWYAHVLEGS